MLAVRARQISTLGPPRSILNGDRGKHASKRRQVRRDAFEAANLLRRRKDMGGRERRLYMVGVAMLVAFGGSLALAATSNKRPPETGFRAHKMYPITVASGWQPFDWTGAAPVDSTDNPFTFTLAQPGYLSVTDTFIDGDRFEVRDGTTLIGTTSVPLDDGQSQADPNLAFQTGRFSWGQYPLAAGAHSINIRVIQEATGFTDGSGYLRVDYQPFSNAIPMLGFVGLAALVALFAGIGYALLRRG
jgi:hypothetical protein